MTRDIEMRLLGHAAPSGELRADDAIRLIESFRSVAYRLTRAAGDRDGLGRAESVIERLAAVKVRLLRGSTRVVFVVGDDSALDVDPLADAVDDAFSEIIRSCAANRRPPRVSDAVAGAVDDLIVALQKAAPVVEVSIPGHDVERLSTDALSREPWRRLPDPAREASLVGTLEAVDSRTGRFRLRDVAGNAVDLIDVPEAEATARLVTTRVVATGILGVGEGTKRHRMESPSVAPAGPSAWAAPPSLEDEIARAAALPPVPPLDLPAQEFDDFVSAARG